MECMGGQKQIPIRNRDYVCSGHDKGHLFPVYHTSTFAAKLATSTLTNAAPQDPCFNRGKWRIHERDMVTQAKDCQEAFMVTGVVPGNGHIGNGVRVAKYYWSALCCQKEGGHHSRGFIGPDNNGQVQELSVRDLEMRLCDLYQLLTTFTVFGGGC